MNVAPVVLLCDKSGALVQGHHGSIPPHWVGCLAFHLFPYRGTDAAPPSITSHGASKCGNAGNVEAPSMADRQRS